MFELGNECWIKFAGLVVGLRRRVLDKAYQSCQILLAGLRKEYINGNLLYTKCVGI